MSETDTVDVVVEESVVDDQLPTSDSDQEIEGTPQDVWDMVGFSPDTFQPRGLDPEVFGDPHRLNIDPDNPPDMETFAMWALELSHVSSGHQFWGGDLWNVGSELFDDGVWQFFGVEAKTVYNWASIMKVITPDLRRPELTFGHYRPLPALGTKGRIKSAIKKAADGAKHPTDPNTVKGVPWTTRQVESYVKHVTGKAKKEKDTEAEEKTKEAGTPTSVALNMGVLVAPSDQDRALAVLNKAWDDLLGALDAEGIPLLRGTPPTTTVNRAEAPAPTD